ncbi:ATP-dependent nuclease [Pseudomonas aeruginosa]|uniref:ATP-dependent nuclease n=1 Tax=Pseudomonas aeruginosa TaxID=287 RepID=UPI002A6B54AB|nr:AAA family ATPase [Pseudomonas aeruginosa]MDY1073064.1 AAA family ATPase [Pseudomonas aeruginosa]MDY1183548.1 AAA family ATPase [Pseudomonas aeruginosa]MDY1304823.1 AAA family ATPase [Pseudomonas aeruginosa]MEB5062743.1 AAA family ATPase [Pseudomonas aeruginosa]MEB5074147.1 AAA family ATPase [Pseudomonas aeruginosa]
MNLNVKINKVKSINKLDIDLPVGKGLYAITGLNGSGKSTLVACASTVFFNMGMKEYFGSTHHEASISFKLNSGTRSWKKNDQGKWVRESKGRMDLKGFYEGSIIYGTRFRNTSIHILRRLDRISDAKLSPGDEFIRTSLGKILHNNPDFYEKLFKINNSDAGPDIQFSGDIFYYEKDGNRVSQFHMSTGENLLVSILNSINFRNNDRASLAKPCIMFLDEIELALHPSSLKRLVVFLREISERYNYAIYFSTHSIELIGAIQPGNIFFLNRHIDGSLEILNPCFPAYATRMLYDHSGYDHVFLVEDDLAKELIMRLLKVNGMLSAKLVHVLPCGGYTNVIELARDVVNSNLLGRTSSVAIILDGDIKSEAQQYMRKHNVSNNIPLSYLPVESLEKYLKTNLHDVVDHKLFRQLNDFIFQQLSLDDIIGNYRRETDPATDTNGKKLYKLIEAELKNRGKARGEIIEMVVNHLTSSESEDLKKIVKYLGNQLTA